MPDMAQRKPMILVVDDTTANIEVLIGILQEESYRISVAKDGKEGVAMAKRLRPDLILMDVMMPVMDGFEATEALKAERATKHIPVIFLTARTQPEDIAEGFSRGGVDYIAKPFHEAELLARIENHLELKKKREELKRERNELRKKNAIVENDLEQARKIQLLSMPDSPPKEGVSFFYLPTEQVGGDYFDFFTIDENRLGIFISDVSGHGVAAAFVTLMIKKTLQYERENLDDPVALLNALNESLYAQIGDEFVTAYYCIIDFKNLTMESVCAGHNLPYMIGETVEKIVCNKKSVPMGIFNENQLEETQKNYKRASYSLTKGSRLLFYTDGLSEAKPKEDVGKPEAPYRDFEGDVMPKALEKCKNLESSKIIEELKKELFEYSGREGIDDDVCIICVEI